MAHYAPEFLAALRQRYEDTDQPMRPLALEFGIGISTLSSLVEREGWKKRSLRQRGSPDAPRIAEAADLMAMLPPRASVTADIGAAPADAPPPGGQRSAAERLEALLMQEIAAEEAARAELGELPRLRAEADGCTRRLAILTQTLKTLRAIAPPAAAAEVEPPGDMDALRMDLARRLNGLIMNRVGPRRMALNKQFADLTDDEMQELAEVGRERGMPGLQQPLQTEEELLG